MKKGKKWYNSFKNWLVLVTCVILTLVLIINLFIIYQSKTNKNKVPSIFGYKPFIVLSGSMEGKIHKGDLIITKVVNPSTLKVQDIIAFRDVQNTVTTHRIIDIVNNNGTVQFITKGDNNSTQDHNLVNLDDVEGLYIARISGFGSIMNSLSKPTTILILSFVITLTFVIGFAYSIKKEKSIEREEFLKFKMMKEEQIRKENQSQKKDLEKIQLIRELQNRGFSKEEILELLRSREDKQKDSDS